MMDKMQMCYWLRKWQILKIIYLNWNVWSSKLFQLKGGTSSVRHVPDATLFVCHSVSLPFSVWDRGVLMHSPDPSQCAATSVGMYCSYTSLSFLATHLLYEQKLILTLKTSIIGITSETASIPTVQRNIRDYKNCPIWEGPVYLYFIYFPHLAFSEV